MKRLVHLACFSLWLASSAAGQTNGIFADFATSHGAFTVFLDHERAPRAVASFVGLATGASSWADPDGNIWERPFYDGSIFHRVVKDTNGNGIAIQGGGVATRTATTQDLPTGVTTSLYTGVLTTTNAAGTSTNLLNLPVVSEYAAAVPTNYVFEGVTVATNAPMITRVRIDATVVSSNSLVAAQTTLGAKAAAYTNTSLAVVVATNICQVSVVITNGSGTNVTTVHSVSVATVVSNIVRAPTVATNFANAGYTMLEAVTNGLVHSNGVIALANSGPNTDGSQFFITATNVPGWDGGYTVFGHVTTGLDVVNSIAAVAVEGAGSRPIGDVVLSNVVIRRVGAAAEAFNIASQGVPVVESGPMRTFTSGTNQMLVFDIATDSKMVLREGTDLQSWERDDWGFYAGAPFVWTTAVERATLGDTYFFHMLRTVHAIPVTSPATQRTRKFTFWWNTVPVVKYEAIFATNWWVQGDYVVTTGTNAPVAGKIFVFDTWTQGAQYGRLVFSDNSGREFSYTLGFNPGQTTNRFTGTQSLGGASSLLSGVFTVE